MILHRQSLVMTVGVTLNGMTIGVYSDGMMAGIKRTENSASSPSHGGSFDLGAMSSPEWSEWVRMDFDTGAAVNTFLLNFGR